MAKYGLCKFLLNVADQMIAVIFIAIVVNFLLLFYSCLLEIA